eukprot:g19854.t1
MAIDREVQSAAPREHSISVDHREVRLCCSITGQERYVLEEAADEDCVKAQVEAPRVCSTDTTRDETPMSENLYEALQDPEVLLKVLQLNREHLLQHSWRSRSYKVFQLLSRILPALVCAVWQYRWGVLLSLTLFALYTVHLSASTLFFSVLGLFRVWRDSQEDWLGQLEDFELGPWPKATSECLHFWSFPQKRSFLISTSRKEDLEIYQLFL